VFALFECIFIMAALRSRCGHYILWPPMHSRMRTYIFSSCFFFFLFPSPNLSGRQLDVYHTSTTSTHGVALVRIYNACLTCAARGSLEMQDPKNRQKMAIWAPSHNFVRLYLFNAAKFGTRVVGVSQSLRRWTEGATYIRQGGHHVLGIGSNSSYNLFPMARDRQL